MRALIEFIMRGRPHACGIALAGYLMPLVSPSTVGLVALKKGPIEGSVVALWAMLPVLLGWFASDLKRSVPTASLFLFPPLRYLCRCLVLKCYDSLFRGNGHW